MMPPVVEPDSTQASTGEKLPSTRPWSSTWVRHYDVASRRRHRLGGYRRQRADAKRKHRLEWIVLLATTASVFVLFAIFYSILSS
jgi:hypothetical protein